MQDAGSEDIRQRKWQRVFDEQSINRLDGIGDCSGFDTPVGEPKEGGIDPIRVGRLDDVSEGTVQEMKIVPWLLAVHLNVIKSME